MSTKIRKYLKKLLEKSSHYLRFRYSAFYLNRWYRKNPIIKKDYSDMVQFFSSLLKDVKPNKKLIFDVGANEGFLPKYF
jgi:hypothetical protein